MSDFSQYYNFRIASPLLYDLESHNAAKCSLQLQIHLLTLYAICISVSANMLGFSLGVI